MSTVITLDKVEQLDSVVEQVASKFESGEEKVHVLWLIISAYMKKPSKDRDLNAEELRDDIRFDLKTALEHDWYM